jgi:minor extracellular serine protease Vpr
MARIASAPPDSDPSSTRPPVRPGRGANSRPPALEIATLPDHWLVELEAPPLSEGGTPGELELERQRLLAEAARAGLHLAPVHDYRTLWNGVSVRVADKRVGVLTRLPGVVAVHPVELIELPPLPNELGSGPAPVDSVAWIGADVAREELGLTGAGVRVGIIDSGIDYRHPDLGGCFGPGCRIEAGWDFIDGDPVPFAGIDSYHGTHVAGIVGARGAVTGVAPGVTFGDYRVCAGFCPTDAILAALERALEDGMDVVNLSLGAPSSWTRDLESLAADRLVHQGVVVVAAAGNTGGLGTFVADRPSGGEHVLSVASVGKATVQRLTLFAAGSTLTRLDAAGVPAAPLGGEAELVFCGRACAEDALVTLPAGRVALIERGGCPVADKVRRVVAAGASAVIVHDDRPGTAFPLDLSGAAIRRPVATISRDDGSFLRSLGSPVPFVWGNDSVELPRISAFSATGPNADLVLKPNLAAPGEAILSTLPLELAQGYGRLSGTSMATPHVTGAVALLLEARPNTPAVDVVGIFMNASDPFPASVLPTHGLREAVHRQGAGLLDVARALGATTRVRPSQLSFGEGQQGSAIRTIRISNDGVTDEVYDVVAEPAVGTRGARLEPTIYRFTNEQIATPLAGIPVASGETASLELTVTPPFDQPGAFDLYGGYIAVIPRSGGETVRIPYVGFAGDYQAHQALRLGFLLPPVLDPVSYVVPQDPVQVFVGLRHPVRLVIVDLFDAQTGAPWHRVGKGEYEADGAVLVSFDGTTRNAGDNRLYQVPDGQYVMRFAALKALGDAENPAHWEEWVSPPFEIRRQEAAP